MPAVLATPKDAPGPFPCVVFVHGIGNDKNFMAKHGLDEPFVKAGFAFVCFDQLMRGDRKLKEKSDWAEAAAFRVRAVVLTYGGGNLRKLLTGEALHNEIGLWSLPTAVVAWYFGSVADPVNYIGQISPRPILLQNGKADTVVAPAAAQALQDAARQPKTILWYEGDHLGKTRDLDMPLTTRVLADALKFIQDVDAKALAGNFNVKSP